MTGVLRRGVTLVELLVALVLLLVLVTISGASMQRVLAAQARTGNLDARGAASSDALETLSRHAASIDVAAADLRVARDTALELVRTVGVTTVCRANADTLLVSSAADTLPWSSTMPRTITSDDAVRTWHDADARWIMRRVLRAMPAAIACGDSTIAWPGRATQQLLLDSTTTGTRPGATVRVMQRERWSLVLGGDGRWSLSLATWDAGRNTFGTPQPLLSPLAAPSAGGGPGLAIRAIDAQGRALPDSSLTMATALLVVLRGLQSARDGAPIDSVRVHVAPR